MHRPFPPTVSPKHNARTQPLWLEVVWTQVSAFKKLMMHMKQHCSYIKFEASACLGMVFYGTSAIDHLCFKITLPPKCFTVMNISTDKDILRMEINMYTLYSIMKKATAYRCERVRFRVEHQIQGYYAITVTFESVNRSECYHMRGALIDTDCSIHDVYTDTIKIKPLAKLDTSLLSQSLNRFDEDSFRMVSLTLHVSGKHANTLSFENMKHTMILKSHEDSMQGKVYIPYFMPYNHSEQHTHTRHKYKIGDYLMASLCSVTRFASLSYSKQLTICRIDKPTGKTDSRPLCITFPFSEFGMIACYMPATISDPCKWSIGSCNESSSSDDEYLRRLTNL